MVITIKNLFLDNNVIIGYIYVLDNLNPESEEIVNSDNQLYYSYHVKSEINEVTLRKDEEYSKFFSLLSSKLRKHKNNEFLSQSIFHNFIDNAKPINKLSIENMHYAFEYIWQDFGFGENQLVSEIKFKLNNFIVDFDNKHITKQNDFIKTANYIPAHRQKDSKIINLVNSKSLNDDLHGEDENILFDLHEYSKRHPELNLVLISWDKRFIKVVSQIINELSFNKYICLEDTS